MLKLVLDSTVGSRWMFLASCYVSLMIHFYVDERKSRVMSKACSRVATHLENLEKSENLRGVRENRKSQGKCVLACTKFGQLVLRKVIEIVAARCQILRLKCIKFDFGWGCTPDPSWGTYSAPQTP